MIKTIGLEAKTIITELQDFKQFLFSIAPPLLTEGNLFIYTPGNLADEASELLEEAELLEEIHPLIKIADGKPGEDFFDYGFYADRAAFLYIDQLTAFKINGVNKEQVEMAILQLEEHLAYRAACGIYFAPRHYNELIQGIVRAYEVEVKFLDLDK